MLSAGNLYQSEVETTRNDASVGLFIEGNGTFNLNALSAFKSGPTWNTIYYSNKELCRVIRSF